VSSAVAPRHPRRRVHCRFATRPRRSGCRGGLSRHRCARRGPRCRAYSEGDARTHIRTTAPVHDCDPSVAIAGERRKAVVQRLIRDAVDRGALLCRRRSSRVTTWVRSREAESGQRLELGAALLRRAPPAVLDRLDVIDEPGSVVPPEPFDAAHRERQAGGLHHRRDVRIERDCQQRHEQHGNDAARARFPPAPPHDVDSQGDGGSNRAVNRASTRNGDFGHWPRRPSSR
jgi:hypothetical protein